MPDNTAIKQARPFAANDVVESSPAAAGLGQCDSATLKRIGKKGAVQYKDGGCVTVEHPTWMNAIGTEYVNLSEFVAEQMLILAAPGDKVSPKELSFLTETVMGIAPADHVEMMLSTQMATVHLMTMNMAAKSRRATNIQQVDVFVRQTNQLMRTFTAQVEALKKYRSTGTQNVNVKHVHVHEGGQAIVGNVTKGGRG